MKFVRSINNENNVSCFRDEIEVFLDQRVTGQVGWFSVHVFLCLNNKTIVSV